MDDLQKIGEPLKGGEMTIWVFADCPFRKDGSPVLGSSAGRELRSVVVMELVTWKRICAENPGLQTTFFRVGTI